MKLLEKNLLKIRRKFAFFRRELYGLTTIRDRLGLILIEPLLLA